MDASRQAVLDLLRLGLKGDSESVRQFGMRLLRRPPVMGGDDAVFREALSRLLLAGTPTAAGARAARGTPVASARGGRSGSAGFVAPVDHDTFAALARVDVLPHAPPPVLPPEISDLLDRVIGERRQLDYLTRLGLEPTRAVLLTGAPGVGKTMAARYLAGALGLPLLTLDLATVVSSYLGKTGQNLRLALDAGRAEPCVLLLDEFDALAKRRDDPSDVGELKRIVNVLVLEIERWPAASLLVAATNHPELLDRAIWRRFDLVLALPLPDASGRAAILRRLLDEHRHPLSEAQLHALATLTHGASGSELARLVRTAARRAALATDGGGGYDGGRSGGPATPGSRATQGAPGDARAGERHGDEESVVGVDVFWSALQDLVLVRLREVARADRAARVAYVGAAHRVAGRSLRTIATDLGVTHPTASQALREYDAQNPTTGSAAPGKRRARGTPHAAAQGTAAEPSREVPAGGATARAGRNARALDRAALSAEAGVASDGEAGSAEARDPSAHVNGG